MQSYYKHNSQVSEWLGSLPKPPPKHNFSIQHSRERSGAVVCVMGGTLLYSTAKQQAWKDDSEESKTALRWIPYTVQWHEVALMKMEGA